MIVLFYLDVIEIVIALVCTAYVLLHLILGNVCARTLRYMETEMILSLFHCSLCYILFILLSFPLNFIFRLLSHCRFFSAIFIFKRQFCLPWNSFNSLVVSLYYPSILYVPPSRVSLSFRVFQNLSFALYQTPRETNELGHCFISM